MADLPPTSRIGRSRRVSDWSHEIGQLLVGRTEEYKFSLAMPEERADSSEPRALTLRHRLFADNYLLHGNASEAARGAGYARRNAPKQGSELLKREDVLAYLAHRRHELMLEFGLSREEVVRELRAVAHSNLAHYQLTDPGKLTLSKDAPKDAMRAVRRFKNKVRRSEQTNADGSVTVDSTIETEIAFCRSFLATKFGSF